jgi:hypothetical protein
VEVRPGQRESRARPYSSSPSWRAAKRPRKPGRQSCLLFRSIRNLPNPCTPDSCTAPLGLYIVDRLIDRWSVDRSHSTRVWLEFDRSLKREPDGSEVA